MASVEELGVQLRRAADDVHERQHLRVRLHELDRQIDRVQRELTRLRQIATDEALDVTALENVTLTRVLATLRGNRDIDLDRERVEADLARLRAQESEVMLEVLGRERDSIASAHSVLDCAPGDHATALAAKERWLTDHGDPAGTRLLAIAGETGDVQAELRDIEEARRAAERALQALDEVHESLDSAHGWSTYDTFFGGGAIGSAVKHDRMGAAQDAAARAERQLQILASEVADVPDVTASLPGLQLDGMTRFLDIWFDNIFTDWSVRERIKEAQASTAQTRSAVVGVNQVLTDRQALTNARLGELSQERRMLLGATDVPVDDPAWVHEPANGGAATDESYPSGAALGAGVLTFFAPFISLVVALVVRSGEHRPSRRGFLKTWAVASGVWLCTGFLFGVVAFASIAGGPTTGGDCQGGVDRMAPPTYVDQGGRTSVTRPCLEGGSRTRELPAGGGPFDGSR